MLENIFSDWKIDGYKAESPDDKYCLWIANGFLGFKDYDTFSPREPLLKGVNFLVKYKIWRALRSEMRCRAKEVLDLI